MVRTWICIRILRTIASWRRFIFLTNSVRFRPSPTNSILRHVLAVRPCPTRAVQAMSEMLVDLRCAWGHFPRFPTVVQHVQGWLHKQTKSSIGCGLTRHVALELCPIGHILAINEGCLLGGRRNTPMPRSSLCETLMGQASYGEGGKPTSFGRRLPWHYSATFFSTMLVSILVGVTAIGQARSAA